MNIRVLSGFCASAVFAAVLALGPASVRADNVFAVSGVHVDASAASATEARDIAIAQGRAAAWGKLFHRLAREKDWPRQPQLDDTTLLHMIHGLEIANEKRSSTRYLAEVTYDFNAAEVRKVLQQAGIAYAEATGKRVLVIPVMAGHAFAPTGEWAAAWTRADISNALTPVVLPGNNEDLLARSDIGTADWATLQPLAARYSASEVVVAEASGAPGALGVRLVRITPSGATVLSLPAQSGYTSAADAAMANMGEAWKGRSAVDYSQRTKLTVEVAFASGREWASIRARLATVGIVSNVGIVGLSLSGAEVELSYVGQMPQLQEALSQQGLNLSQGSNGYVLRSGAETP